MWEPTRGDSLLILFPPWWPVGVGVWLERSAAPGDTVRGVARAFVADAQVSVPTSTVRAWRAPCAGAGTPRAPDLSERERPPSPPERVR